VNPRRERKRERERDREREREGERGISNHMTDIVAKERVKR